MKDPNLDLHIFICTNEKENGKRCCSASDGKEIRKQLKSRLKENSGIKKNQVRVNASGCLGHCSRGVAAVFYPSGEWFFDLKLKDVERLEARALEILGDGATESE